MDYRAFLRRHDAALKTAGLWARAWTLQRLLESCLLVVKMDATYYTREWAIKHRQMLVDALCEVCVTAQIPLPDIEPDMVNGLLPTDQELKPGSRKRLEIVQTLRGRLRDHGSLGAAELHGFADVLSAFEFNDFSGPNMVQMLAAINARLLKEGLEPLRGPYKGNVICPGAGTEGPLRTVLIVDDSLEALIKTWIAVAGWPTLEPHKYLYEPSQRTLLEGEASETRLAEVAAQILKCQPDVVIMDHGLGDIHGDKLIETLRASGGKDIIFVANTGGDIDAFRSVRLRENFDKGKNLSALASALHRANRRR